MDLVKIPREDPYLSHVMSQSSLSLSSSLLSQIIYSLVTYFTVMKERPGLIEKDVASDKIVNDNRWESLLTELGVLFR